MKWAFGICGLLMAQSVAAAPGLAVYVTDADEDVFVALYGTEALTLDGCTSESQARQMLQLDTGADVLATTLAELEQNFALGQHPSLPCVGAPFDGAWPATAPIWADLAASGQYFLRAPTGSDLFYALPSRCEALKDSLAIRERIQLPGVLQGMSAPAGLGAQLVLDCGDATDAGDTDPPPPPRGDTGWSLHSFENFDELGARFTILVARFAATDGTTPAYLPIWRVDNVPVADTMLAGGAAAADLQQSVLTLLGLPSEAEVAPLTGEAVIPVRGMVHVDLCLATCGGYIHQHAVYADPLIDLSLSDATVEASDARIGADGSQQISWSVSGDRSVVFEDCPALISAVGVPSAPPTDWSDALNAALSAPTATAAFACEAPADQTCQRVLTDGETPTATLFRAGADCPGAQHLRVAVPAATTFAAPIDLIGTGFETITIAPIEGAEEAVLTVAAGRPSDGQAPCIQDTSQALIFADGLKRLVLRDITLRRANGGTGQANGIIAQNSTVTLAGGTLGTVVEGTAELERGLTVCQGQLYLHGATIAATELGLQTVAAQVSMVASGDAPARVQRARFGALLRSGSRLVAQQAELSAHTPILLRGGRAEGRNVSFAPPSGTGSTAILLERAASAEFALSIVRDFGCVASFADTASEAVFILPGNDLAGDNTRLACGTGRFSLLE